MKERPIIFNGADVRAILDGRKSMTRRVIKPQPVWVGAPHIPMKTPDAAPEGIINCPYGWVGTRLWVRETWADTRSESPRCPVSYRATWPKEDDDESRDFAWRPSIHMPRWASRITLEITGVRVERLQDIQEQDAIAEGVEIPRYDKDLEPIRIGGLTSGAYRIAFKELWEHLNSKRGFGWDSNPWVWVVEFRRLTS